MRWLRCLSLTSIRTTLLLSFSLIGLIPAVLVGVIAYRSCLQGQQAEAGMRLQTLAEETIDKIDRNLFERYGDVQAFAANPKSRGSSDELTEIANLYTRLYGIYDLMVIADVEGNVLASNTVDFQGKPVDATALYKQNVAQEAWFREITQGKNEAWTDSSKIGAANGRQRPLVCETCSTVAFFSISE